jgi:eukaryotic-like serine/threonine-protein kinase
MALAPGTRLGAYEIVSALGAGGMGEVYRATDPRLKRQVAIKVLPQSFADDPERLARFQREAELLALMNHPHIATVYGLEEAGGINALVMELVDGEDLAKRIARGRVPLPEALAIARQTADALDAAHERGVIHRDLKPANIKVRADGAVKVLDFGLAKAIDGPAGASQGASTTVTSAELTRQGAMLGTVAYMSPEQIRGRPATRRSDIWAFGCVMYEMLTGQAPFAGRTAGEVLANVLKSEPDWQQLPADTPEPVRRLLRRALAKDDRDRLHDIVDARLEIDDARGEAPAGTPVDRPLTSRRERLAWLAAVLALAAAAGTQMLRPTPATAPAKLVVDLTTAPVVDPQDLASFALSPDGTQVVATGVVDGRSQLVLRGLDSATSRPLPGTVGGMYPFWSPDGRSIGFFVDGYLRRLDVDAGLVRPLTKATVGVGGSWNADGAILFAPTPASPIFRTSSDGAPPATVTALAAGHAGHAFPHFLPDGRHFLYFVVGSPDTRGVYVGQLDGSAATRLFDADAPAVYTAGQLIFVRNRTLYAQPFDAAQLALRGSPSPVADGVMGNTGYYVTVSAGAGTVAFRAGSGRRQRQFVRVDRTGREIERLGEPDDAQPVGPTPSPDGGRVAVFRRGATDSDVWLFDTRRGVLSRFTTTAGEDIFPAWSRDGSRIAFTSTRSLQGVGIYARATAGGDSDTLLVAPGPEEIFPSDWSPDGRTLVFMRRTEKTGWDLWALPLGGGNPSPLIQTDADERNAQISPDGKWIAYVANTSGREEVYVQRFPTGGTAMQVSDNGGAQVRWRPDGRELFYLTLDSRQLVAVAVGSGGDGGLVLGTGAHLFAMNVGHVLNAGPTPEYVPSADGQRFLINIVLEDPRPTPLRLVMHWAPGP